MIYEGDLLYVTRVLTHSLNKQSFNWRDLPVGTYQNETIPMKNKNDYILKLSE